MLECRESNEKSPIRRERKAKIVQIRVSWPAPASGQGQRGGGFLSIVNAAPRPDRLGDQPGNPGLGPTVFDRSLDARIKSGHDDGGDAAPVRS
jgi:hypothetical protein